MSPKIGIALMIFGVALTAVVAYQFGSEYLAADTCLDQGGSFNYSILECDKQVNHPFVPFRERHPLSGALFLFGALLTVAGAALYRARGVA